MAELERSDDVRKRNRAGILGVLRHNTSRSRKGICAKTGLSASTVSAITSELLDEGIIVIMEATATENSGRGRPQVRLALNPAAALVASIVLQLDRVSVTISDYAGNIVAGIDRAFEARLASPQAFYEIVKDATKSALS